MKLYRRMGINNASIVINAVQRMSTWPSAHSYALDALAFCKYQKKEQFIWKSVNSYLDVAFTPVKTEFWISAKNDRESEKLVKLPDTIPKESSTTSDTEPHGIIGFESEKCTDTKGRIAARVQLNVKYIDVRTDWIDTSAIKLKSCFVIFAAPPHTCRPPEWMCSAAGV